MDKSIKNAVVSKLRQMIDLDNALHNGMLQYTVYRNIYDNVDTATFTDTLADLQEIKIVMLQLPKMQRLVLEKRLFYSCNWVQIQMQLEISRSTAFRLFDDAIAHIFERCIHIFDGLQID